MKIWFFVEGESESNCVIQIIRKFYPSISVTTNPTEYIDVVSPTGRHCCYVDNCGNVDRIPFEINEQNNDLVRSNTNLVVVFCDIEKSLMCASNRKQKIETSLDSAVDRQIIKFVLSRLTIESTYWQYPNIMKKTIKVIYSARRSGRTAPLFEIPDEKNSNHAYSLNRLMRSIGNMSYKKPEFADYFFPRLPSLNDFSKSETLGRLKTILDSIK